MEEEHVSEALLSYANKICSILQTAEMTAGHQHLESFINSNLGAKLGPAIQAAADLLHKLQIGMKKRVLTNDFPCSDFLKNSQPFC